MRRRPPGSASRLSERTYCRIAHRLPEPFEKLDVLRPAFAQADARENVLHLAQPLAAGRAASAGLVLGEVHALEDGLDDAAPLVDDAQGARSHLDARLAHRLEVDGRVEELL
jgi:hypothetical protein